MLICILLLFTTVLASLNVDSGVKKMPAETKSDRFYPP